jgi:hypothetical protein
MDRMKYLSILSGTALAFSVAIYGCGGESGGG